MSTKSISIINIIIIIIIIKAAYVRFFVALFPVAHEVCF